NTIINDIDNKSLQLFEEYKSILYNALEIIQEQENINNIQWAQAIQRSFKDFTQLLESEYDYNVVIEIGEKPNNKLFKVHSIILHQRSL
ncbi:4404_t:CDS:2, partial [Scutellospora calospora]